MAGHWPSKPAIRVRISLFGEGLNKNENPGRRIKTKNVVTITLQLNPALFIVILKYF